MSSIRIRAEAGREADANAMHLREKRKQMLTNM